MKIYFIGQKGIPAVSGGVESHVEELSVRLAAAGHEVYAYTRPNYTDAGLKEFKGVRLISLPSIASKHLDAISHTFRACLDVSKRDADIIHFHSIGPSSLIWVVRLLKLKAKIISTFHTQCYRHKKWGFFARLYLRFGEWACCNLSDKTIAISKGLALYVKNKYGRTPEYIPNGVSVGETKKADLITKAFGLQGDDYILTVSRLVRHKGIQHLIRAFKQTDTDKKLVIVGGSSYTDGYVKELEELARGDQRIIFTGIRSGDMLRELYSNAFLFVQPSESEGLSIALLEAMSYRNPVLVSDIPENMEVIDKDGYSFKSADVHDLIIQLKKLLSDEKLPVKSRLSGYGKIADEYDWDKIAEETMILYKNVLIEESKG